MIKIMDYIDYKQLMYGNWVLKNGKYYQVRMNCDNRLILEDPNDGEQLPITTDGIEGIPFTGTILENNGFIKKRNDWRFERTDFYLFPMFDGTEMKLRFYQLKIQYFHELQNLFTLCGFNSIALELSPVTGIFKPFINTKFGDKFKLSDGSIALWTEKENTLSKTIKLYVENYGHVDFDIATGEGVDFDIVTGEGKDVEFEALFVTEKL